MTLSKAIDIAEGCGLSNIEEAVLNVDIHAISIFSYDKLSQELGELYSEYDKFLSKFPNAGKSMSLEKAKSLYPIDYIKALF